MSEWERCGAWIQAALDHGGNCFTLDDVLETIQKGQAQFWPGKKCALVTEIKQYPRKRLCNVWLAGGDLDELIEMSVHVKAFAKNSGCDAIALQGRPGWQKIFPQRLKTVTLIEEVSQ
jgi:Zn-finger nucleic acid-binding protein